MMRLNTGQRLALNLDSHIAVDAGAGTGKTRTIVERVIQHYLSRVRDFAVDMLSASAAKEYEYNTPLDHVLKLYVIQGGCTSRRLISGFSDSAIQPN